MKRLYICGVILYSMSLFAAVYDNVPQEAQVSFYFTDTNRLLLDFKGHIKVPQGQVTGNKVSISLTASCTLSMSTIAGLYAAAGEEPTLLTVALLYDQQKNEYILQPYSTHAFAEAIRVQNIHFRDPQTRIQPHECFHFHLYTNSDGKLITSFICSDTLLTPVEQPTNPGYFLRLLISKSDDSRRFYELGLCYLYGMPVSNLILARYYLNKACMCAGEWADRAFIERYLAFGNKEFDNWLHEAGHGNAVQNEGIFLFTNGRGQWPASRETFKNAVKLMRILKEQLDWEVDIAAIGEV